MSNDLKSCLTRMAIDPDRFSEFLADPKSFAEKAGLSTNDQAVLLSGDQNEIYLVLQDQNEDGEDGAS